MGAGDGGHNGEPEAGPWAGWLLPGAVEAVEDAHELISRDAGAVVADLDGDGAAVLGRADGGDGAGRGVGADVGEQVVDGPAQQLVVTDGLKAGRNVCLPGPLQVGDAGPLGAFGDEGGEVDRVALLAGMLVESGQPEHVVDQAAHPLGFQRNPAHRLVDLRAVGKDALLV